jgi:hypothetical protein
MVSRSSSDIQKHISAMRGDIERMAQAVDRIAKEGARTRAAMAKTAARATRSARVSSADMLEEALNLGSDAGKASIGIVQSGAEAAWQRLRSPIGVLLLLSGIGLLSRHLFRR